MLFFIFKESQGDIHARPKFARIEKRMVNWQYRSQEENTVDELSFSGIS